MSGLFNPLTASNGLFRRLTIWIVLFSTLITFLITLFQIALEYRQDVELIHKDMSQIQNNLLTPLINSVWVNNDVQIVAQLEGMQSLGDIEYVGVRVGDTVRWKSGYIISSRVIKKEIPLLYRYNNRDLELGVLEIVASIDKVFDRLIDRALVILVSNAIKTFIVASFILFIFQFSVSRHLTKIVKFLSGHDPIKSSELLFLDRKVGTEAAADELEQLAASINSNFKMLRNNYSSLRTSEERFIAFANNAPNKLNIKDTHGRYLLINRKSEELFGVTNEEAKGKTSADIFPSETAKAFDEHDRAVIETGKPVEKEEDFILEDGVHTYLTVKFPILGAGGDIVAVGSSGLEITQRKQIQAQIIQSSKLATLGEMATGMAHELNQPLNIIQMTADLLLEMANSGDPSSKILEGRLERILSQTERASAIINHMQIFGRMDSGEPEEVDLREAVHGAVGLVKEQMRLSEIKLLIDFPDTCRKITGQQIPLEQVVLNLLTNARDAIHENGTSDNNPRRISIQITDDPESQDVHLSIQDTGGGIADEIFERIFEPFFTTKVVGHGTGLGLSISYGIISDMGGRLKASNDAGGAKFTISLPAAE